VRKTNGMKGVVALILAGGVGSRLGPLTRHRSKPSVPFGKHRIIDFVMSNCLNSDIDSMMVLTQYRAQELIRHIQHHWPSDRMRDSFIEVVPPQQLHGEEWYRGTADAVFQNLSLITESGNFTDVAVLSGDHVFMMDFRQMFKAHQTKNSVFTVCAMPVPLDEAHRFGVIEVDTENRIVGFEEKPPVPKEIPGRPGWCFISMGNYIAGMDYLRSILHENAGNPDTSHDFGKDIIPMMVSRGEPIYAYDFRDNVVPNQRHHYWRDVGTIQSLWEANMDLVAMEPELNLYNQDWVIRTPHDNLPMAKFNSLRPTGGKCSERFAVSGGSIIENAFLHKSVLGREVWVYDAEVHESVLFAGVHVENGVQLNRVIVDEGVSIPSGIKIGFDPDEDRDRGLYVDESGIVVVPKGFKF
jgi:glucose-1-phosphate adenylyltransferase